MSIENATNILNFPLQDTTHRKSRRAEYLLHRYLAKTHHPYIFIGKETARNRTIYNKLEQYKNENGIYLNSNKLITNIKSQWEGKGDNIIINAKEGFGSLIELKSAATYNECFNQTRPIQFLPLVGTIVEAPIHLFLSSRVVVEEAMLKLRGQHTISRETSIIPAKRALQIGIEITTLDELYELVKEDYRENHAKCKEFCRMWTAAQQAVNEKIRENWYTMWDEPLALYRYEDN